MINESPNFTSTNRASGYQFDPSLIAEGCASLLRHLATGVASLCQRRVHSAFGGTHAALASFYALLMRVAAAGLAITAAASIHSGAWLRVKKGAAVGPITLLLAALLASICGCSHPVAVGYSIPSVVPVSATLSTTRGEIERTRVAIAKASGSAARLAISAAERHELQSYISEAAASVQAADNAASLTMTNLGTFNASVTNQTAVLNTTSARLDYLEPKYQHAVALVWKWRLLFLGTITLILAFISLKYGSRLVATAATLAAKIP